MLIGYGKSMTQSSSGCSPAYALLVMVLLASCVVPSQGDACRQDEDCSLNGRCVKPVGPSLTDRLVPSSSSSCQCFSGWKGDDCALLDTEKVTAEEGNRHYLSGTLYPQYSKDGELFSNSWGGNVVELNGTFHLFVSEMANNCTLQTWGTNSLIRRATSKTLKRSGGYAAQEVIMPPFTHNANPILIPPGSKDAGMVVVYHVGDGTESKQLVNCSNTSSPPAQGVTMLHLQTQQQQLKKPVSLPLPYGLPLPVPEQDGNKSSTARPSSEHIWNFRNITCIGEGMNRSQVTGCPHLSNAAPLILGNGTTLVVHSGQPGAQGAGLNIAISYNSWYGPFEPVKGCSGNPCTNNWYEPSITTIFNGSSGCTDPYLYMDTEDHYHCIFHCHWKKYGDAGAHAFSRDGTRWTTSMTPPFTAMIELDDGTSLKYTRQRPHLVLRGDSIDGSRASPQGVPIGLITGVKLNNYTGETSVSKGTNMRTVTHLQPIKSKT